VRPSSTNKPKIRKNTTVKQKGTQRNISFELVI
jgi:hypothetical protein